MVVRALGPMRGIYQRKSTGTGGGVDRAYTMLARVTTDMRRYDSYEWMCDLQIQQTGLLAHFVGFRCIWAGDKELFSTDQAY